MVLVVCLLLFLAPPLLLLLLLLLCLIQEVTQMDQMDAVFSLWGHLIQPPDDGKGQRNAWLEANNVVLQPLFCTVNRLVLHLVPLPNHSLNNRPIHTYPRDRRLRPQQVQKIELHPFVNVAILLLSIVFCQ